MSSIKDLSNGLRRAAVDIENKSRVAIKRAGNIAEDRARDNCPVDTGSLRGSLVSSPITGGFELGTDVEYAIFVDKGHLTRGGGKFIPGNNFIEKGMESAMDSIDESISDIFRELDKLFS